jgi:hypothetical protein
MKQKFLLIFLISTCFQALGQPKNTYEYLGTLELPGKVIIPLKLNFRQLDNEAIEGFTITDIYGTDNTKSRITGKINTKDKRISFKEIENISTKSQSDASEFCFIQVNNAKIRSVGSKRIIQGSFEGRFPDGRSCTNGNIYLVSADAIDEMANKLLTSERIKNTDSLEKAKRIFSDFKNKTANTILEKQESLTVQWKSSEISIELWDASSSDSDEVSLFINDVEVLEKFVISHRKKILILPFKTQICTIKIVANNEGKNPPNTASITVRDGDKNTTLITKLKKGDSAYIKLTK